MVEAWPLLASAQVFDAGIFRVDRDRARSPRTGAARDFHVLRIADFVIVVALTRERQLVLVRQYRHGSRAASLEVPGGLHDVACETPQQGAARELLEETGYGGGAWCLLGELRPQPAMLANRAWIFLATGLALEAVPQQDAGEDIEVVLLPAADLVTTLAAGRIDNAMSVAALAMAQLGGHLQENRS